MVTPCDFVHVRVTNNTPQLGKALKRLILRNRKDKIVWALSIYEKKPEISVVAKVEFPIGKKLFHLVVNPGTWRGARPWTWNWYKLRET